MARVKRTLPNHIGGGGGIVPTRQWLDDANEWTGLSADEIWRKPQDRGSWKWRVSRVDPSGLIT